MREEFHKFCFGGGFIWIDRVWAYFYAKRYNVKLLKIKNFRSNFRSIRAEYNHTSDQKELKNKFSFFKNLSETGNSGLRYLYKSVRIWLVPAGFAWFVVYYLTVLKALPFSKIMCIWISLGMIAYWLLSGFVFFVKKYQFGKYTSAVQRFWRRSYIIFWFLEFMLFGVFLFLTLNANQESWYMFDQICVFKAHLFSWRVFFIKIIPVVIIITLTYYLMVSVKFTPLNKQSHILLVITAILLYVVWLEFYQFFHILNFYGNLNWIYDVEEHVWTLEIEPIKTRQVNNFVMLLMVLKFWHIIFIFAMWVFFLLRVNELGRIRYPLLSANFQNFIILYIFAWLFMYPWFKFFFRKYLGMPYMWFIVNNRRVGARVFFNDITLVYYGVSKAIFSPFRPRWDEFHRGLYWQWSLVEAGFNYEGYRKNIFKKNVLEAIRDYK